MSLQDCLDSFKADVEGGKRSRKPLPEMLDVMPSEQFSLLGKLGVTAAA